MKKKLYQAMNWREIEAIIYCESENPHDFLSLHKIGKEYLAQAYFPNAKSVSLVFEDSNNKRQSDSISMELVDEAGFFATIVSASSIGSYHYHVSYDNHEDDMPDVYAYLPELAHKDIISFDNGSAMNAYEILGAHITTNSKTRGVQFSVWAPNALSVCVVGSFNNWNGCLHQMSRVTQNGIFSIFVPNLGGKFEYQYEIKCNGSRSYRKSDPYARIISGEHLGYSIFEEDGTYLWRDAEWMQSRDNCTPINDPINICSLPITRIFNDDNSIDKAREIIKEIADLQYTHVELTGLSNDFYTLNQNVSSISNIQSLIDLCHECEIGVIMDLNLTYFKNADYQMKEFDGTCLYEHLDPRRGVHPQLGTLMLQHARPQVASYLKSCVMYWLEQFHIDGFRFIALAEMLYLDYGRLGGDWIPNVNYGNTDLEAIDFITSLNKYLSQHHPGIIKIADMDALWSHITKTIKKGSLEFDFELNHAHIDDMTQYMSYDPYFRAHHHDELILSMVYGYNEFFISPILPKEVDATDFLSIMPQDIINQQKNLRLFYAYMMMHPGKKLWDVLHQQSSKNESMICFLKDLNEFYKSRPALFEYDNQTQGFSWINNMTAMECLVTFERMCDLEEEALFIVANFADVARKKYTTTVPHAGKYKEIFSTDAKQYGGTGVCNQRIIKSTEISDHDFDHAVTIKVPALGLIVFSYTPYSESELQKIEEIKELERFRVEEEQRLIKEKELRFQAFEIRKKKVLDDALKEANDKIVQMEKEFLEEEKEFDNLLKKK